MIMHIMMGEELDKKLFDCDHKKNIKHLFSDNAASFM